MRLFLSLPLALSAAPAMAQQADAPPAPIVQSVPEAAAAPATDTVDGSPLVMTADAEAGDIVVVAERIRGQVDTAETPIATFNEDDIAALGASSVGDLLSQISPQTGSGRGRGGGGGSGGGGQPVVLVNGQRITSFREMRNFPSEAIRRVEVLPETVALKYGFPPDTRVVNLILKPKFRSKSVEAGYSVPTLGGFSTQAIEASLSRVDGAARLSVTGSADRTSPLFNAERGVLQPASSISAVSTDPQIGDNRSLIAQSNTYALNAAWTRGLGKDGLGGALSLSAAASRNDAHSFLGNDIVRLIAPGGAAAVRTLPGTLDLVTHQTGLQAGAGYNTFLGGWQVAATLDGSRTETITLTDRSAAFAPLIASAAAGTLAILGPLPALADPGIDRARSVVTGATSLATAIGRPLRLPGGWISATVKAGYARSSIDSTDNRPLTTDARLRRGDASVGFNLAIPLTSRREKFGAGLGDLTLNLSGGLNQLSDFGLLADWSAGLTWAPTSQLSLSASYIVNAAAPTLNQLGDPITTSINRPRYDFATAQTVLITAINGGNPLLLKERQRDLKFGAQWQLPFLKNASAIAEYFRNRSDNVSAGFPLLTPRIEAAFPGRVVRDASGQLVSIDQRTVTFARQDGSRLRAGINLSGGFGKAAEGGGAGGPGGMLAGLGRGGGGGGAGPGGGGRGGFGGGGGGGGGRGGFGGPGGGGGQPGRWSFGIYDTVQFTSRVLIAPGGPVLDLLGGDALSSSGTPRNTLEFNGGVFYKGLGTFFQGTYTAPTRLAASGVPGVSDLRFGSLTSINANLFFDFNQRPKLIKQVPFLKGARLSVRAENLLGARQRVTDASGAVPLSYQADYLDPRGRVIRIELRKTF